MPSQRNTKSQENPKSIFTAIIIIAVVGGIIFTVAEMMKPQPSLVDREPLSAELRFDQPQSGLYFDMATQQPLVTFSRDDAIRIALMLDACTPDPHATDGEWAATLTLYMNRGNETYLVSPQGVLKNRKTFLRMPPEVLYEELFKDAKKNEKYLSLLKQTAAAETGTQAAGPAAQTVETTLGAAAENMDDAPLEMEDE